MIKVTYYQGATWIVLDAERQFSKTLTWTSQGQPLNSARVSCFRAWGRDPRRAYPGPLAEQAKRRWLARNPQFTEA